MIDIECSRYRKLLLGNVSLLQIICYVTEPRHGGARMHQQLLSTSNLESDANMQTVVQSPARIVYHGQPVYLAIRYYILYTIELWDMS